MTDGYKKVAIAIGVLLLCLLVIFGIYKLTHKTEEVQGTSQTIAETPTGVKIAGDTAGITLDDGQAKQVSTTIREIRETQKEPVYIVQTTGKEVVKESEQARKDNKADFSIVTDKNNPDKVVDLEKVDKDSKVELSQYNIQCFKKVIRQIEVGRTTDGYTDVGFSISRKITNDGQYIGIGISNEFNGSDNRTIAKIIYSW